MKKLFNYIIDINGKKARYPIAENEVVFGITGDDKCFIYALYTKKNLSEPQIIQISYDTYQEEVSKYKNTYNSDPIVIYMNSEEQLKAIVAFARYKALVDNTSIASLYNLDYKSD